MQEKAVIAAVCLFFLLAGCIQFNGKDFSDLEKLSEKYGLDGYIAPGTLAELESYKNDLLSLKAQAFINKNRESEALTAAVDYKLAIIETQKSLLLSKDEARFIDYYDTSCSRETSIKKTIDYLDNSIAQAELSLSLSGNFQKNYPEFLNKPGTDFTVERQILTSLESSLEEKKNKYKAFCT
jgi:hypothetical protein